MPNAELEIIPRAYHELFTESDDIRERSLSRILDFLSAE
jgi:lysophospholipase